MLVYLGLAPLVALGVALLVLIALGWRAFGQRPSGERLARIQRSPHWKDGRFQGPLPVGTDVWGALSGYFDASKYTVPKAPMSVARVDPRIYATPPATGLRATWLGHSTLIVEIDGHRVLTDPVWSDRISPYSFLGPRAFYAPLIALKDLPSIDAVVISHDHYDHLDYATIRAMRDWPTTFVVPLGIGAHLAYWGVPEARIVELDWWETHRLGDLELVATPARHTSGRTAMLGQDQTLWAGFAMIGKRHRAWYSGDTGMFPGLREIGERLGPFDLTLIEAGAYGRWWPDWHLGPEQAMQANAWVRGKTTLGVHLGRFNLAYHGWTEPLERLLVAARAERVLLLAPRPGESVEPEAAPPARPWWPALPWQTARENPIVSSGL